MAAEQGAPVTTMPVLSAGKRPVPQPPSRAGRDVNLIKGPVGGSTIAGGAPHTSTVPQRPELELTPGGGGLAPAAKANGGVYAPTRGWRS